MAMNIVRVSFITFSALFYFVFSFNSASAATVVTGALPENTIWTKAGSPYIAVGVSVTSGKTLTIEPGVHVKLQGDLPLYTFGTLNIGGEGEEVTLTSYKDDSIDGDTNNDGSTTVPGAFDWCSIGVHTNAILNITNTTIRYGGCSARGQLHNLGGTLNVTHSRLFDSGGYGVLASGSKTTSVTESEISGATIGVRYHTGTLVLKNNSIHDNSEYGMVNTSLRHTVVDATENWWGSDTGPFHATLNPGGLGNNAVSDYITFDPWLDKDPFLNIDLCVESCFSNVLFLPGIKTSRLYTADSGTEDKLWEPNAFSNDVQELFTNKNGESIKNVYAKEGDVIDETITGNIYKTFISDLASLKTNLSINDYSVFAYDWRQSAEDIAVNGTRYQDGVYSAVNIAENLAATSKSSKVTLVAHSNGGLLAKALMMELEKRGLSDKVDKIIFIGSPQMGTPFSVLSALYGYDEAIALGAVVSRSAARELIENLPGAYGLLPSKEYFNRINDPLVTFSSENTRYKAFQDAYGNKIQNYDEFKQFLLGDDGRSEPDADEVDRENVLNQTLLQETEELHGRLDSWVPPANVEVIQIGGWGIDTISGVKLSEKEKTECRGSGKTMSCTGVGEYEPVYEPVFSVDGDEVVVTPSALMLPEAENVKRYWVDLLGYNKSHFINRKHKDLLEVRSLEEFVFSLLKSADSIIPNYIFNQRPGIADDNKLRMSLYSPLDIHLYDSKGNHTGPKKVIVDGQEVTILEESIPNSYYYQFGDRKYVGFDEGDSIDIRLDGYDEGSYTLKFEEVKVTESGDETVSHTAFANLPTTSDTEVTVNVPEEGISELDDLKADLDGDGEIDYELTPVLNGSVTLDNLAPVTIISQSGVKGENDWYVDDVTVALHATDEGSGVSRTEYSLDNGTTWGTYSEPFTLAREGDNTIQYFSTDISGNKEEVKTNLIKIDKTAPEAKIFFNQELQKIDVVGIDEQSMVEISNTDSTFTLKDEAGHSTVLVFSQGKEKKHKIEKMLNSIAYDGEQRSVSSKMQYKWAYNEKKESYQMLAAALSANSILIESHYRPKKDFTTIMQKPVELDDSETDDRVEDRPVKEKLSGLVIPFLETSKGEVLIKY